MNRKEYQRQYYEANREAIAKRRRQYYEANREAVAERHRQYYEANREATADQQRQYRESNREVIADKRRQHYGATADQRNSRTTAANDQSKIAAIHSGERWTAAEDAIATRQDISEKEKAYMLRRTIRAVKNRAHILRRSRVSA